MTTDPATLVQHHGHPVPWVTRWTDEAPQDPIKLSMDLNTNQLWLTYSDGREDREEGTGILWHREGIKRGGRPEFAQVSAYRQRAAMRKCLCQVCGKKIDERPIRWLMAKGQLKIEDEQNAAITFSPPTCSECIPLALELCPFLRESEAVICNVLEYRLWGVYGECVLFRHDEGGEPMTKQMQGVYIAYDRDYAGLSKTAVAAKQQVVEFTKFTVEEL